MLLAAARLIGIVDPQQKAPAAPVQLGLPREQPVVQRGADIADVQRARRAGGKTGNDHDPVRNLWLIG